MMVWPSTLVFYLTDPGGNSKLTTNEFYWLNLMDWVRTVAIGFRGRRGTYCDGVALHLGFLGAQDQIHDHHTVIPPAT